MKTVKEWWDDFEAQVVPKEAGDIQRLETKNAFYGGLAAGLSLYKTHPERISLIVEEVMVHVDQVRNSVKNDL